MKRYKVVTNDFGTVSVEGSANTVNEDNLLGILDEKGKVIALFKSWTHFTTEAVQPPLPHFQKLHDFYKEVIELTVNHNTEGDSAVVYPRDLGTALEKVDKFWFEVRQDNRKMAAEKLNEPTKV